MTLLLTIVGSEEPHNQRLYSHLRLIMLRVVIVDNKKWTVLDSNQ